MPTLPHFEGSRMKAKIRLPEGWTKGDTRAFLRYIKPEPEDKEERDSLVLGDPKNHCWRDGGCQFWSQDGEEEYQGHCDLHSCHCLTAVLNHKNPPRWSLKQQ